MAFANPNKETIDVLTRLVTCLAEHITDIEAELAALKAMHTATLQCVAEVNPVEVDRQFAEAKAAHKSIAESRLLEQIRAMGLDPSVFQLINELLN